MRRGLPWALCLALILLAAPVFGQSIPGLMDKRMSLVTIPSAASISTDLQLAQAAGLGQAVQRLQAATPTPAAPGQNVKTPEPYKKEEFPQWLQDFWRVGVIFVGSLPFTYFYTLESYDIYRYAKSGFNFTQAPWPFRPGAEIGYSPTEQLWLIVTSVALSAIITGTDFLIDQLTRPQTSAASAPPQAPAPDVPPPPVSAPPSQ